MTERAWDSRRHDPSAVAKNARANIPSDVRSSGIGSRWPDDARLRRRGSQIRVGNAPGSNSSLTTCTHAHARTTWDRNVDRLAAFWLGTDRELDLDTLTRRRCGRPQVAGGLGTFAMRSSLGLVRYTDIGGAMAAPTTGFRIRPCAPSASHSQPTACGRTAQDREVSFRSPTHPAHHASMGFLTLIRAATTVEAQRSYQAHPIDERKCACTAESCLRSKIS
ncbi:hypothetical protein L1887_61890 [Cichorium endivia]|nr:hypothetical protein L1887_61890 [Cichorium endivia]